MRRLDVWLNRRRIGVLAEGDDLWRFEHDTAWAADPEGFDLAPGLPRVQRVHEDGSTHRPVQWYFDNLLPEEALRERVLKEAGIQGGDDAFALLTYLGAESAGSLTLQAPGGPAPSNLGERQALSDETLERRIADLGRTPLSAGAPKRMSLAGAQNKLPVICAEDGRLYEPVGGEPSTHILKPNHTSADYAGSVMNEYFTMTLARRVGLPVPRVFRRYVPNPVYIVERFDRVITAQGVERRHIIDACQLLNRSRVFKTAAGIDTLRALAEACRNRAQARLHIFRWLVFCMLVGNDDNHLKNLSFLVGPEGVALAPYYDLLSTATYHTRAFAAERSIWPQVPLMVPLPGAATFAEVSRASMVEAGGTLGLSLATSRRVLDELRSSVDRMSEELLHDVARHDADHPLLRPEDRNVEHHVIRTIRHVVIQDMVGRLG